MEYLHQITDVLHGWQLEDSSACQKYGLLLLGGIGSMTVGYNLWLFTRVLFSLFILPGKSVSELCLLKGERKKNKIKTTNVAQKD
jgi:hypothetical protein